MGWNGFNVSVIKRMENLSVAKRLNTRLARARDSKESTRLSFHSGLLEFKKRRDLLTSSLVHNLNSSARQIIGEERPCDTGVLSKKPS